MKNLLGLIFLITSSLALGNDLPNYLHLVKEVGRCQLVLSDFDLYSTQKYQIRVDGKFNSEVISSHSFNSIQAGIYFQDYYVARGICAGEANPPRFKVIEESGRCQLGLDYEAKTKMATYKIYVNGKHDDLNRRMRSESLSVIQNNFIKNFKDSEICGNKPEKESQYKEIEKQGRCQLVFDKKAESQTERYKVLVRGRYKRKYYSHSGFVDEARELFDRYFKKQNDLCFELPSDSEVSAVENEVHTVCKEYGQKQRMTLGSEVSLLSKIAGSIKRNIPFTDSHTDELNNKINPLVEKLGDNWDLLQKGKEIKKECMAIYQSEIDKEDSIQSDRQVHFRTAGAISN